MHIWKLNPLLLENYSKSIITSRIKILNVEKFGYDINIDNIITILDIGSINSSQ